MGASRKRPIPQIPDSGTKTALPRDMQNNKLAVGEVVTTNIDFFSAIGEYFRAGTSFTVIQVGDVNVRAQAGNGSLVWIANHRSFFTGKGY